MPDIALFTLIGMAAVLLQSFVGFGGGLFAIPLLTLFLAPRQAVPALVVPLLCINVCLVFHARRHVQWPKVARLLAGAVFGVPVGVYFLRELPAEWIGAAIGAVTFGFACLYLLKVRVRFSDRLPVHLGVGFISGILGGGVSQGGPPVIILGVSQGWAKDSFRATLLAYFAGMLTWSISCYALAGLLTAETLKLSAAALAPMALAAVVGTFIKSKASEPVFRTVVLAAIAMVGLIGLTKHLL